MKILSSILAIGAAWLVGLGIYIIATKMSVPFGSMILLAGIVIEVLALERLIEK
jgi:hypothetical protein